MGEKIFTLGVTVTDANVPQFAAVAGNRKGDIVKESDTALLRQERSAFCFQKAVFIFKFFELKSNFIVSYF